MRGDIGKKTGHVGNCKYYTANGKTDTMALYAYPRSPQEVCVTSKAGRGRQSMQQPGLIRCKSRFFLGLEGFSLGI